jgi:major membrane immunogen (membrane-anchored lipoprotein)
MLSIIAPIVLIALSVLFIVSRKPYAVSPQQFEGTLVRVLEKKIDEHEWDNFVHITIGSDAYLDSLRERLLKLETNENSVGAEEGAVYNSTAMQQVAAILEELRSKVPIQPPQTTTGSSAPDRV